MKAVSSLPDGYKEILKVNLQKDKKIAMAINIWAIRRGFVKQLF